MKVRLYVEGGGDRRATSSECRRGFAEFLKKIVTAGHLPKVIASGSRREAFDDFRSALATVRSEFVILLVDSEGPVPAADGSWAYRGRRKGDEWERPAAASEDQAHLMVECMEAWFLADKEALIAFYGQGFLANSLPARHNVEDIPKLEVYRALAHATANTKTKGKYHKTHHAFDLLAQVDPAKVCAASVHAKRFVEVIKEKSAAGG